jgi:glycosyltransferase involved in cell wall biosynthesis
MKIGYLMQAGVPDIRQRPLSGPANHVWHVYKQLEAAGHQMKLLAVLDGQIWSSTDLETFTPVTTVWLDRGPLRLLERAIRRIQSTWQLPYAAAFESLRFALACRRELADYDLWYERMGWFGYGGAMAARWSGIPLVWEVNGDHLTEFEMLGLAPQGGQRWLSVGLVRQAARRLSHVVATGEGWRQRFIERWGVAPDKVTVVENGSEMVDLLSPSELRAFQPPASVAGPVTLIYIGAFEPWHGLHILLPSVAKAVAQGVSLRLILVGAGTQREELEQLAAAHGLAPLVTFTGRLQPAEFARYLRMADIGLSPYCGRVEFSGLKLLDYKAAGLATIASGQDGQPAVLEHGRTGWIVPPCDEEALCRAIVRLATDVELRQTMGRQARLEAEQIHSWRHTVRELEQIFCQVTGE